MLHRTLLVINVVLAFAAGPAMGQRIMSDVDMDERHLMAEIQSLDHNLFEQLVTDVPKLDVVVRIPDMASVPIQLQKYIVKDGIFGGKRLRISGYADAAIATALMTPEFHAEFERPNSLVQPILEIGPYNLDARRSHFVPEFEAAFIGIRGAGVRVGLFDEGLARPSHQEFASETGSRVSAKTSTRPSLHSTHCAGMIAAKGIRPEAIGMATGVSVNSYDWNNDLENLDRDAGSLQVSSHSYGPLSGWVPGYPLQGGVELVGWRGRCGGFSLWKVHR